MPNHRPPESKTTGDKPTRALGSYILAAFLIAIVIGGIYIYHQHSIQSDIRAPKPTER